MLLQIQIIIIKSVFLFLVPLRCNTRYTPYNKDGGGNFVYLDRHQVGCGQNEMMVSMGLVRDSSHKNYRYKYTCCTTPYPCHQRIVNNPFTDDGRGNAIYMDRQNVQCSNDNLITFFHLNRNSAHNKVRYTYKCCNIPGRQKKSYDASTPWNDEGGGHAVYLDRHHVHCNSGYGLTKFHLVRNGHGRYQYRIRCTKIIV